MENESDKMLEDDTEPFSLLHAACFVNCPLAMVQLACTAFPEQLRFKDSQLDRLPLHYAASRRGYAAQYPIGVSYNVQRMEEVSPVKLVASEFPGACRVADGIQQLPLHIAIDHAKEETQQHEMFQEFRKPRGHYTDIEVLLQSYPDALQRRDGMTKLYPFLQAAEGCEANLDLTYILLRRDPSLVRTAIQ
jgi:hypothetical protein